MNVRPGFQDSDELESPGGTRTNSLNRKLFVVIAILASLLIGRTFAANISLDVNEVSEFGQGVQVLTQCAGANPLNLVLGANFVNRANEGTFLFSDLTVTGVPSSCAGRDFSFSLYRDDESNPRAIMGDGSTAVYVNFDGTDYVGRGRNECQYSVTTVDSSSFKVAFLAPVETATSLFKVTMRSLQYISENLTPLDGTESNYSGSGSGICLSGTSNVIADPSQAPTISAVVPNSGRVGDVVTIQGSGFTPNNTEVKFWRGRTVSHLFVDSSTVQVTIPGGILTGKVTLSTPVGSAVSPMSFVLLP